MDVGDHVLTHVSFFTYYLVTDMISWKDSEMLSYYHFHGFEFNAVLLQDLLSHKSRELSLPFYLIHTV